MILALMWRKRVSLFGKNRRLMIFRGLCGFIALSLYFYTLGHLPVGTAVLLNYTSPIFSAILAVLFLNEKISRFLLSMIFMAFAGVYLLLQAEWNGSSFAFATGLISAVFAAGAYVLIRAIKHRESPLTVIFYFVSISTIGSLFYLPFGFRWPDLGGWLAVVGVGLGSFWGQLWMTIALRRARASFIVPFSYLTPVLCFFYGLIFFGETLNSKSLAGTLLIILAGSLLSFFGTKPRKHPDDRPRAPESLKFPSGDKTPS